MLKTKPLIKTIHQFVVERLPIISDYVPWHPIPIDDVALNKVYCSFFFTSLSGTTSAHLEK